MTLLINFHQSQYRTFKDYYEKHVCLYLRWAFPNLVSYSRFVQLMPEALLAMSETYLYTRLGECSGISFIDSTALRVCENRRFQSIASWFPKRRVVQRPLWDGSMGSNSICSSMGELLSVRLTPGNTNDRSPVREFAQGLFGKLYGDKGYISKSLREALCAEGVSLVYKVRKNMAPQELSVSDAVLLKKRVLIESVIKELKTQTQLQHTRHRSLVNFQVNTVSALIAYTYLEKKPSLNLRELQEINDQFPVPCNFKSFIKLTLRISKKLSQA